MSFALELVSGWQELDPERSQQRAFLRIADPAILLA